MQTRNAHSEASWRIICSAVPKPPLGAADRCEDLRLYLEAVEGVQGMTALAPEVRALWRRLVAAEPNADLTRMYPFVKDGRFRGPGRS